MECFSSSDPCVVGDVITHQVSFVVSNLHPSQSKRSVDPKAFIADQIQRCKTCRTTVIQTSCFEANVVLVGEIAGYAEQPVDFENTVVENRIGVSIHDNIALRVVRRRENIPILPEQRRVHARRTCHEGECCFAYLGGTFTNDVASNDFVRFRSLVQDFTLRNVNLKVDCLNCVGDAERCQGKDSAAFRGKVNRNVNETSTGIRNSIVETFDDGIRGANCIDGFRSNQRAILLPANRW